MSQENIEVVRYLSTGQTLRYSNVVLSAAGGAATLSFPGTF